MTDDVETLTNDEGTRRVVVTYDTDHAYPSDWDDIWGSFAHHERWSFHLHWQGRDVDGVDDAYSRWSLSDDIAHRYLRIFHDVLVTEVQYSRSDWGWVVTERLDGESVEDWEARHAGNTDVWLTYLGGDVYTLTLEEKVTWLEERPTWDGGEDDERRTLTTWEHVDSLGGVAGYDYAMNSARRTLEIGEDEIYVG